MMTKPFLLLALFIAPFLTLAQGLSCKIVDDRGRGIPFANVYSPAFEKGTISDAQGLFTLPDVPAESELRVSCIGFEDQRLTVRQLTQAAAGCRVTLASQIYEAVEVEVKADKMKFKRKKVGLDTRSPMVQYGFGTNARSMGFEVGTTMDYNGSAYVERVGFNLTHASGSPRRYEINLYALEGGRPTTPLQKERIFVEISEDNYKERFEVDISQQFIRVDGSFFVSLEAIEGSEGKGTYSVMFSASLFGGKSLQRNAQGEWEKESTRASIYAVLKQPR